MGFFNTYMRTFLFILGAMLVAASGYAQPKIGQKAPEISMTDITGKTRTLSSLKGKVVLVDFWASWCMPCRKSNREVGPIYNQYAKKGFEVFAISLDTDKSAWKQAVDKDKINWLQMLEPGGWDGATALAWKIDQLPTSFLVDRHGVIISIDPSPTELQRYLGQALN